MAAASSGAAAELETFADICCGLLFERHAREQLVDAFLDGEGMSHVENFSALAVPWHSTVAEESSVANEGGSAGGARIRTRSFDSSGYVNRRPDGVRVRERGIERVEGAFACNAEAKGYSGRFLEEFPPPPDGFTCSASSPATTRNVPGGALAVPIARPDERCGELVANGVTVAPTG